MTNIVQTLNKALARHVNRIESRLNFCMTKKMYIS